MRTSVLTISLAAIAFFLSPANGLSQSACDNFAVEYTTDTPRLTGVWPYYNLLYTCSGNISVEGFAVDACVSRGKSCGQPAADAFCQYLGFDKNAPGLYSTITAKAPALSLTGEWCVSNGIYEDFGHPNRTEFETIQTQYRGPYCASLASVTCIRNRTTIAADLSGIQTKAAQAPATPPNAQLVPGAQFLLANPQTITTAGRRMKGVSSMCA